MRRFRLVQVALLITLAGCGSALPEAELDATEVTEEIEGVDLAILGGVDTSIESAPWQVSLLFKESISHFFRAMTEPRA